MDNRKQQQNDRKENPPPLDNPNNPEDTSTVHGDTICGGEDEGCALGGEPEEDNTHDMYWQSPEAKKLFEFSGENVDVVEGLQYRINLFKQVLENEDGYQLVIPMTEDSSLGLSSHSKFTIRNKSLFLLRAYQVALSKLRVGVQWIADCCDQAVTEVNSLGPKTAMSGRTVSN